jgi:hypothetical protein
MYIYIYIYNMSLTVAEYNRQLEQNFQGYELIQLYALSDYSFKWFKPINILLRNGYDGLTAYFEKNKLGRGITNFKNFLNMELLGKLKNPDDIPEAIKNVKMRIKHIDSAFLNAAPRTTGKEMIVFRGKKGDYYNQPDSINTGSPSKRNIDTGYISTSKNIEAALNFINNDKEDIEYKTTKQHCCLYRMHIMKGIPYIDMNKLSKYSESEILLPRDLKITTIESDAKSIKTSKKHKVKIIDIKVEKSRENQFDKKSENQSDKKSENQSDKKSENQSDKKSVGGNRRIKRRTNKLKNTHKRRTTKRRTTKRRITKRRTTKRRTKKRTLKY